MVIPLNETVFHALFLKNDLVVQFADYLLLDFVGLDCQVVALQISKGNTLQALTQIVLQLRLTPIEMRWRHPHIAYVRPLFILALLGD